METIAPSTSLSWKNVLDFVLAIPPHKDISIPKIHLPHPSVSGFIEHFGDLGGQRGDYRLPLPDGKELHVKEFDKSYRAHWDKTSAINNPLGHLFSDAFHWVILIGVLALFVVFGR